MQSSFCVFLTFFFLTDPLILQRLMGCKEIYPRFRPTIMAYLNAWTATAKSCDVTPAGR
jgi:hypothetical protein